MAAPEPAFTKVLESSEQGNQEHNQEQALGFGVLRRRARPKGSAIHNIVIYHTWEDDNFDRQTQTVSKRKSDALAQRVVESPLRNTKKRVNLHDRSRD